MSPIKMNAAGSLSLYNRAKDAPECTVIGLYRNDASPQGKPRNRSAGAGRRASTPALGHSRAATGAS
jgi:hypothetical protein